MRTFNFSLSFCIMVAAAAITAATLSLPDPRVFAPADTLPAAGTSLPEKKPAGLALVEELQQESTASRKHETPPQEGEDRVKSAEENRVLITELRGALEALRQERAAEETGAIERLSDEQSSNRTALMELRQTIEGLKEELAAERVRQPLPVASSTVEQSPPSLPQDDDGGKPAVIPTAPSSYGIDPFPAERGTAIAILGGGLFRSGQNVLTQDLEKAVQRSLPAIVASQGSNIVVEGHTDSYPIGSKLTGRFGDNRILSLMRAEAVANLLEKAGVDRSRITIVGYGGAKPIAPNSTLDGRAENRRVEIRLVPPQNPLPQDAGE